jgi:hypothetical protein
VSSLKELAEKKFAPTTRSKPSGIGRVTLGIHQYTRPIPACQLRFSAVFPASNRRVPARIAIAPQTVQRLYVASAK